MDSEQPQAEILERIDARDKKGLRQLFAEEPSWAKEERLIPVYAQAVIDDPNSQLIVARSEDGEIVSGLVANTIRDISGVKGRIDNVVTVHSHRHCGYAGALVDFALQWLMNEQGVRTIFLLSRDYRHKAHVLYQTRGFIQQDSELVFFLQDSSPEADALQ